MADPSATGNGDDLYDLAPERPAKVAQTRPAPAAPVALGYRGAATSGGGHRSQKFDERTLKDVQLPLVLLCGGIAIAVVAAVLQTRAFEPAMRHVGINLIAGTLLMLAGIVPAARLRGVELGPFWTVVLKLSAITVAPSAVVWLATPVLAFIPLGGIVGFLAEFVLYFALLGVLFDLDESDTWYCVWVIFLVRLAVYFVLLGVAAWWV